METTKITEALEKLFNSGHRLVFWNDPDEEFTALLDSLSLDSVEMVNLDTESALYLKSRVLSEPQKKFLLYSAQERPPVHDDWLLDLRLWGTAFSADRASMLMTELGLANQTLRAHLKKRKKFLASKERVTKLGRLCQVDDADIDLDRGILAVVTDSGQAELFDILIAVFSTLDPDDLDAPPGCWDDIEKYGLIEAFWALVAQDFGYGLDCPSLKSLVLRLFVSEIAHTISASMPNALEGLSFDQRGRANASVCLARWRDSARRSSVYVSLARAVGEELKLQDQLATLNAESLIDCFTVEEVDRILVRKSRDQLVNAPKSTNLEPVVALCRRRSESFWASNQKGDRDEVAQSILRHVYKAIEQAVQLLNLEHTELPLIDQCSQPGPAFDSYCQRWFRFDQHYRVFCDRARYAASHDWDVLKPLEDRIEDLYVNGFLARLGMVWSNIVEDSMLDNWQIGGTPNQQSFYSHFVQPVIDAGPDRRAFVVISDAFRYEAADELTRQLNGKYRIEAKLEAQLGVLPSYTTLGMAALLPHKTLSYDQKGAVALDGKSTAGIANRKKILETVNGFAVKADDLMKMTKDEGRKLIKPHRVIYIYHNLIDAVGDTSSTENGTFEAVRNTIKELSDLVKKVINSLNGTDVFVTADHGFLFQQRPMDDTDRSTLKTKPNEAVLAKKRYVLGKNFDEDAGALHGHTLNTAGALGEMEFLVPRSNNRFHFVGGARFVHGGAMLQEVAVPVVTVHHTRGAQAQRTRIKTVGVSVLGNNFKITTNRHVFNFIQNEAVGPRVKPASLRVGVYDGDQPVSNVETITFDTISDDLNQWKRKLSLTLQSKPFDSSNSYWLILRDAETDVEAGRYEITIDLAFNNDF